MNIIPLLLKSRIFQNVSEGDIRKIIPSLSGRIKRLQKKEVLISEEDEFSFIGIVLRGELSITKDFLDGSQTFIQKALPSFVVGVDIIYTRSKLSPYTIMANEDSDVFLIPHQIISKKGHIDEDIRLEILNNILTLISHENVRKFYTIEILSKKSLRERIVIYLTRQMRKSHSDSFTIHLNREQLADYLGVNRSALSHELGKMKREGLIKFDKNNFTLLDKFHN